MSDNVDASVDLHLLVKELHEVTEWYTLGALLGLTENEIKEIEQNHHETARRRMAMLSKWVKKDKNPSWLKIITALEEISETSLANQLREKYTATHQPRLSAKRKEELRKKFLEQTIPSKLPFFEKRSSTNENGWLYNGKLTWADLAFYLSATWMLPAVPDVLKQYPGLQRLYASVESLPNIAKWIKERPHSDF